MECISDSYPASGPQLGWSQCELPGGPGGREEGAGVPHWFPGLATCLQLSAVAPMGLPPPVQVHFPHATDASPACAP